jgi:hypothetical protein
MGWRLRITFTGGGANPNVVKPVRFEEFVEALQKLGEFWAELNEQPDLL